MTSSWSRKQEFKVSTINFFFFLWPWWRHRECSDPRDTKSESKIPSTLLIPLLRCGLLRTLSTLIFWSTMGVLPFHVRHAMPRSVNACINLVIVLPIIVSIWKILIFINTIFTNELGDCGWMYPDKCGDIWMWWHLWKSTLVGEEKPAAGINASSSGKCQQIDFSGIAARIPTFLWCDHDSNLPLVRPGFQPSACATRIPTFRWCDQDSNLPLARPGFQPSSGVTRIPTFLWCYQDSNLPLVRPGFQPSSGATRIPTFLWCDQDSNLPLVRLGFQPRCLGNPVASRLNAHSQIHWFLEDQAKKTWTR